LESSGFLVLVGDVKSGIGFKPFWLRLPGPGHQLLWMEFFDSSYYWKPGCISRLLSFDWLSSLSGSKVMA